MLDAPRVDAQFIAQQSDRQPWQVEVKRRNQVSLIIYPFNPLDVVEPRQAEDPRDGRGVRVLPVQHEAETVDGGQHDALEEFSSVMLSFVLPITVVTLVAMVIREQGRGEPGG